LLLLLLRCRCGGAPLALLVRRGLAGLRGSSGRSGGELVVHNA